MTNATMTNQKLYRQTESDLVLDNSDKQYVLKLRDLPQEEKPAKNF